MNRPPDSFEESGDGVTNDRGSEVADMHLLRDVDAADVDGHAVRFVLGFDSEPLIVHAGECDRQRVGLEAEVQKARPGDLRLGDHAAQSEVGSHEGGGEIRRHVSRFSAEFLGEGHRGVQLEVTEFGLGAGLEGGIDTGRGISTDRFNSGDGGGFDSGHGILDGIHRTKDTGTVASGVGVPVISEGLAQPPEPIVHWPSMMPMSLPVTHPSPVRSA